MAASIKVLNRFRVPVFGLLFGLLAYGWEALRGSTVEYWTIHDMTVRPAAALVNWLTPTVHAQAQRFSLQAPGGGLNILNGCEGIEALFLLIAAFMVAPMTWRARGWGLLWGIGVVFAVNQLRILGLFYAYRGHPQWFDVLHGNVAPILVVVSISAYFYGCLYLHRDATQPA